MFKNNQRFASLATVIILLFTSVTVYAERLIPFQGRLTDGAGQLIQGVERVTFAIYDEPTGGTALWSEVHDSVSIIGGQVNVLLGSKSNLDDLNKNLILNEPNDSLDFTNPRYLGITIGVENNQEMLPRHQLVPSFHARTADRAFTADHALLADQATQATNAANLGGNSPSYYAVATGTSDGLATLTARLDALETFANAYTVPTGTVMPYAGGNLPAGEENDYYFCDGQWVTYQNADGSLNTANQALWNVIKFRYGKQDLSGTGGAISFRLPDYRGMFLRGWANGSANDPDRASRTGFDIDGNAIPGDVIGSKQLSGAHQYDRLDRYRTTLSAGGISNTNRAVPYDGTYGSLLYTGNEGTSRSITLMGNKASLGDGSGVETRPINTSVRYIIKR